MRRNRTATILGFIGRGYTLVRGNKVMVEPTMKLAGRGEMVKPTWGRKFLGYSTPGSSLTKRVTGPR